MSGKTLNGLIVLYLYFTFFSANDVYNVSERERERYRETKTQKRRDTKIITNLGEILKEGAGNITLCV